jgi:predicted component of type VI protein secretion system
MSARLVALDEGPDIVLDRDMVVVGRHPACDTRLDSLRVSRHHCCITQENGEVVVRDLGSTNGIRINGQRVESGRLRPGDELSIAHLRYRLQDGPDHQPSVPPPQDSVKIPPTVSTEAWIWIRPTTTMSRSNTMSGPSSRATSRADMEGDPQPNRFATLQ